MNWSSSDILLPEKFIIMSLNLIFEELKYILSIYYVWGELDYETNKDAEFNAQRIDMCYIYSSNSASK